MNFCTWCEIGVQLHSFACGMWISHSSTICWKDYSFSIKLSWHTYGKSSGCKCKGLFSILVHWPMVYPCTSTILSWLLSLCSKYWNWDVWISQLFSFSRLFCYRVPFYKWFPHLRNGGISLRNIYDGRKIQQGKMISDLSYIFHEATQETAHLKPPPWPWTYQKAPGWITARFCTAVASCHVRWALSEPILCLLGWTEFVWQTTSLTCE